MPVKIIQLTDTHLFADDDATLLGIKNNTQCSKVLSRVLQEDHDADFIFLTGDLSQDETINSYEKLVEKLAPLAVPIYWIPGNHDNIATMTKVFAKTPNFHRTHLLSLNYWDFIFLNTKLDGYANGYLPSAELAILQKYFSTRQRKLLAIIMHHHPIAVNTPLTDRYILENHEEFWPLVANTRTKLIMCGHVHGDYRLQHNNISVETGPSTCFQCQKGTVDLAIEKQIGYKVYYFYDKDYTALTKLW